MQILVKIRSKRIVKRGILATSKINDNTSKQVITVNGKQGMLFTSNINGKSIFIVFAGYWDPYKNGQFRSRGENGDLWSSEVIPGGVKFAWALDFYYMDNCSIYSDNGRAFGYSVRGVLKK